ncbi:hypothetical protein HBH70_194970 [Parastagonospora nodorum]|nr:hypothetical protein HBH70_194970 [Parastagonospora nodorum]KAH6150340.1 hypothetical protein HBI68_180330 [Parastagonospora nodorum]
MPSQRSSNADTNPQLRSRLFGLPLELRQTIYSYLFPGGVHAYFRHDKLRLSACLQPDPYKYSSGAEHVVCPEPFEPPDSRYLLRLGSTWGPHWECEEAVMGVNQSPETSTGTELEMLHVCRRARQEVTAYITNIAVLHITGSETLQSLLEPAKSLVPQHVTDVVALTKRLSITLRLSTRTFDRVQEAVAGYSADVPVWLRFCQTHVQNLTKLREFQLWADHDRDWSWSRVNERAFLAPLETLAANSDLNIIVNLPKLHPKYESQDRHFTIYSTPPSFTITRRLRQSYYAFSRGDSDQLLVRFAQDFPTLYQHGVDDLEEVEQRERKMWENGEDPT